MRLTGIKCAVLGATLLLAALLPAGCAAPQTLPAATAESAATPEATQPAPPFTVGNLRGLLLSDFGWMRAYSTGDALYEVIPVDSTHGLVVKTDYAAGRQECVCRKPGCIHDSGECPAYLSLEHLSGLYENAGSIYLGYTDYNPPPQTDESAAVGSESYIEVLTPGAAARTRLVQFPVGTIPTLCWGDENALYAESSVYGERGAILRYDLRTGQISTHYLLANEQVLGVSGSLFVTTRIRADQALDFLMETGNDTAYGAAMQNAMDEYDLWDLATDTRQQFYEEPQRYNGFEVVLGGALYRFENSGGGNGSQLVRLDIADGTLRNVGDPISMSNAFSIPCFSDIHGGKYPQYLWALSGNGYNTSVIDTDSGAQYPASWHFYGENKSTAVPLAQTDDGRWLLSAGLYYDDQSYHNRPDRVLVEVQDYLNGGTDYTPVLPYEGAE